MAASVRPGPAPHFVGGHGQYRVRRAAPWLGVVVAFTKALAIIPICSFPASWHLRSDGPAAVTTGGPQGTRRAAVGPRRIVPLFIVGFAATVAVSNLGMLPSSWHHQPHSITAALAAIGPRARRARTIALWFPSHSFIGAILWPTTVRSVPDCEYGLGTSDGALISYGLAFYATVRDVTEPTRLCGGYWSY